MSVSSLVGAVSTARTFLANFSIPCLYIAGVAALVGAYGGWQVTSWAKSGAVAGLQRDIEAMKLERQTAQTRAAQREIEIRDEVRAEYEPKQEAINALAVAVRDLGRGVRVCESTSRLQLSQPAAGIVEASPGEQSRTGEAVLRELVETIAERCDQQGNQLNALIQWVTADRSPP